MIRLISSGKEMIHLNIYVVIAIGNQSIQQNNSHLVPMNILAPEWLYIANHSSYNMQSEKDSPDPSSNEEWY